MPDVLCNFLKNLSNEDKDKIISWIENLDYYEICADLEEAVEITDSVD